MLAVPRPEVFVLKVWEKVSPDGTIYDPAIEKQVSALLEALGQWVDTLRRGSAPA